MRKAKTLLKQRMKVLRSVVKNRDVDDSILSRIGDLKNTIRNCEFDLNGRFSGNEVIKRKLQFARDQLKELEELKIAREKLDDSQSSVKAINRRVELSGATPEEKEVTEPQNPSENLGSDIQNNEVLI